MTYSAKTRYRGEAATNYEAKRLSNLYWRWKWAREVVILRRLLRSLPKRSRILDVPSGTGRFLPLISKEGHIPLGTDISWGMTRQAMSQEIKNRVPLALLLGDAEHLPFGDQSVDVILSMRFLHHLPDEILWRVLREFRRVARTAIITQLPLIKPITPMTTWLRNLLRPQDHRLPDNPIEKTIPDRSWDTSRFGKELRPLELELLSVSGVMWPWGQNSVVVLRTSADS